MKDLEYAQIIVRLKNGWLKSHGLGNDYIVFDASNISCVLDNDTIVRICDSHYGIGSDGILVWVDSKRADFGMEIFNPDGSQAEKSGNGLRIFADYVYSMGFTDKAKFSIEVGGEIVKCALSFDKDGDVGDITVDIGKATFVPSEVPVLCDKAQALDMELELDGETYLFSAVSVGNPHAVCIVDDLDAVDVKKIGAMVETHEIFPNRTNVQFAQVMDRGNAKIEIWERGAGYTLASGSSSCAVAAVLHKKGLVDDDVHLHMPGGVLYVSIGKDYALKLRGPVERSACGVLL
ncbi:MAG: diaminopimelate epimerase [Clostridia bacterium]|jgi:diaminopimelate epimerase|nr:diaminopimelate epimerase [Clostridia bacterium]MBT7121927.1 diaminopimelate epimerase [Clostridia bacterium]